MAIVIITGGTGLIGTALSKALVQRGDQVIIYTRNPPARNDQNISYARWNVEEQTIDKEPIANADFLVHCAGANVAEKRWTTKRKREIVDSRVKSGQLICQALREVPNHVEAVFSSSGIGYYGADNPRQKTGQKLFQETDPPAGDFLGTTVQQWEEAIGGVRDLGKRLVIFRTGIVLSNNGGAYKEFKMPLKFGLASVLGNGKQVVSWIHIDDLVRLYVEAIDNGGWKGIYNAVSPHAVSNRELITQIAKHHGKLHVTARVPGLVLKAVLGEMSVEVLKSAAVSSGKIQQEGFQFLYPTIEEAVSNLEQSPHT